MEQLINDNFSLLFNLSKMIKLKSTKLDKLKKTIFNINIKPPFKIDGKQSDKIFIMANLKNSYSNIVKSIWRSICNNMDESSFNKLKISSYMEPHITLFDFNINPAFNLQSEINDNNFKQFVLSEFKTLSQKKYELVDTGRINLLGSGNLESRFVSKILSIKKSNEGQFNKDLTLIRNNIRQYLVEKLENKINKKITFNSTRKDKSNIVYYFYTIQGVSQKQALFATNIYNSKHNNFLPHVSIIKFEKIKKFPCNNSVLSNNLSTLNIKNINDELTNIFNKLLPNLILFKDIQNIRINLKKRI
tara:strand:- start:978 stop:1886 length:909 start_codon:yes stop_codon:yes gene_type:complete